MEAVPSAPDAISVTHGAGGITGLCSPCRRSDRSGFGTVFSYQGNLRAVTVPKGNAEKETTGEKGGTVGNIIRVSVPEIKRDQEQIQDQMEQVANEMNLLSDAVKRLNGMWTGPANAVYVQQAGEDIEMMGELIQQIGSFVQCMVYASQHYVQCERGVSDAVASIST